MIRRSVYGRATMPVPMVVQRVMLGRNRRPELGRPFDRYEDDDDDDDDDELLDVSLAVAPLWLRLVSGPPVFV